MKKTSKWERGSGGSGSELWEKEICALPVSHEIVRTTKSLANLHSNDQRNPRGESACCSAL